MCHIARWREKAASIFSAHSAAAKSSVPKEPAYHLESGTQILLLSQGDSMALQRTSYVKMLRSYGDAAYAIDPIKIISRLSNLKLLIAIYLRIIGAVKPLHAICTSFAFCLVRTDKQISSTPVRPVRMQDTRALLCVLPMLRI